MKKAAQDWRTQIVARVKEAGIIRSRDLVRHRIARSQVQRLEREGVLLRVGRGVYTLPGQQPGSHHSLAAAATRIPNGVVCLLSALAYHRIGTQLPRAVWLALDRKAWRPREMELPLEIVRFSGAALRQGVQTHSIDGVPVRIYSPAKTVADCFKYRNKLGLDVALEALREGWRGRHFTMDQLDRYARVCRVSRVIQPYLQSLTAAFMHAP